MTSINRKYLDSLRIILTVSDTLKVNKAHFCFSSKSVEHISHMKALFELANELRKERYFFEIEPYGVRLEINDNGTKRFITFIKTEGYSLWATKKKALSQT